MSTDKWATKKFSDILERIVGGRTPKKSNSEHYNGDIPFLTVKDINDRRLDKSVDMVTLEALNFDLSRIMSAGTLIITTRMNIGKISRPVIDFAINQDVKALFFRDDVEVEFIEYWLIMNRQLISSMGRGTTVKGISLDDIKNLSIRIPDIDTQRRVVSFIRSTYSKLEETESILHINLIKLRNSLNFSIDYYLTEATKEFNLKEDYESAIYYKVKDVCDIITGYPFKSANYSSNGIPLLRGENVKVGHISWDDSRFLPIHLIDNFEKYLLNADDIVVAMDRPVIKDGLKIAMVGVDDQPSLLVQRVAKISPKSMVSANYLYLILKSTMFRDYITRSQKGALIPHISKGDLENFEISIPNTDVQKDAVTKILGLKNLIDTAIHKVEASIKDITILKSNLLTLAYSGVESFDAFLPIETFQQKDDFSGLRNPDIRPLEASMDKDIRSILLNTVIESGESGISSQELLSIVGLDYELMRDAIFSMLDKGDVEQRFDRQSKSMRFHKDSR